MKTKKIFLLAVFCCVFLFTTPVFANSYYWPVKNVNADALNIRSGYGTSYPIKVTISNGHDVVSVDEGMYANGDFWTKVFYPNSGAGQYSTSYSGYADNVYLGSTGSATGLSSTTEYSNASLSSSKGYTHSAGYTYNAVPIIQYPNGGSYQYKIVTSANYPNAWIVVGSDHNNSYVNGWYLNAN